MNIIVIASDHNGVECKKKLKEFLKSKKYKVIDIGPFDTCTVDYTEYAKQLSTIISNNEANKGILICGTGVGMSIVANRFKNIRAVLAHNIITAVKSREHNNSNILCLGAWISPINEMKEITIKWLKQDWEAGRHIKRVETIDNKTGIVLVSGIFDILHKGHLELLKFANTQGNKLIVAIDSDDRVKLLKGNNRPINLQDNRKKILQSNRYVDEVIIFNTQEELIKLYYDIKPDIIVKGAKYTEAEIRKNDKIPNNIKIELFPIFQDYSTTNIIDNIKKSQR